MRGLVTGLERDGVGLPRRFTSSDATKAAGVSEQVVKCKEEEGSPKSAARHASVFGLPISSAGRASSPHALKLTGDEATVAIPATLGKAPNESSCTLQSCVSDAPLVK